MKSVSLWWRDRTIGVGSVVRIVSPQQDHTVSYHAVVLCVVDAARALVCELGLSPDRDSAEVRRDGRRYHAYMNGGVMLVVLHAMAHEYIGEVDDVGVVREAYFRWRANMIHAIGFR